MTTYKFIKMERIDEIGRKTPIYEVQNKNSGAYLGSIKWYAGWRQYCFFPSIDCVFSAGCLLDIVDFIQELMKARTEVKI